MSNLTEAEYQLKVETSAKKWLSEIDVDTFVKEFLELEGENVMPDVPMITITQKEYDELQDESAMLAALDAAGVDNWSGYDDALNMLAEWEEEENQG